MMILRRSTEAGGLHPEARATLEALLDAPSRHGQLDLRPPLGAYNASLQDVVFGFESALDTVDAFPRNRPWQSSDGHWDRRHTEAFERLLYTLVEHIDTCTEILRCFLPDDVAFRRHPVVREWEKRRDVYRDRVATIVNSIKHKQRRLRGIVMHDETRTVPGYYVEMVGVTKDGEAIAHPDTVIHPEGNTAISVYRDLRFHFAQLYLLGHHLSSALTGIATATPAAAQTKSSIDPRLFQVAMRIAALPPHFFPDEVVAQVPAVGAGEDTAGIRTIWVEYPSSRIRPEALGVASFSVSFTADGATRLLKGPYAALGIPGAAVGRNDPCPCNSGKKYKKCHGAL